MRDHEKVIEVVNVRKEYGDFVAVKEVSFSVAKGEIFGFLGPNGAGKTTLIRILTTLSKKTSGEVSVGGYNIDNKSNAIRKIIGVVPQALTSDLNLTGFENMDIYGRYYGIPSGERKRRIHDLLQRVGLQDKAKQFVSSYSGGMRRRLEIARALINIPKILFLDEPTIGLDPQSRRVIWDILRDALESYSMTVFLTTHYMDEAESLSDRVAIIDRGEIIALDTVEQLKKNVPGNDIISLSMKSFPDTLIEKFDCYSFVHQISRENGTIKIHVDNGAKNLPIILNDSQLTSQSELAAAVHTLSLEDVFIHFTGKTIRD